MGKGKGSRYRHHFKKSNLSKKKHLSNIINAAKGDLPAVILKSNLTNEGASNLEIIFIKAIGRRSNGGPLINLTNGGEGTSGWTPTKETKDKLSKAAIKRFSDPKERTKASKRNLGFNHTKETKLKMSRSHQGKSPAWWKDPILREQVRLKMSKSGKGKKIHKEWRNNLSKALIGKKKPEGFGAKISKFHLGRKRSPETCARISAAKKGLPHLPHSEETKRKMREAWIRRKQRKI